MVPIGILIELEKDWHIYWRNSGDTGIPTSIEFDLPKGISTKEIQWPVPKVFEFDGLASFGYEKQVLLVVHHLEEIPPGFDRALLLAGGQVVASGPIEDVIAAGPMSAAFGRSLEVARRDGRWTATGLRPHA